ncbi:hypothetical protein V8C42DRAFT_306762 [Trichoderma barbatum]
MMLLNVKAVILCIHRTAARASTITLRQGYLMQARHRMIQHIRSPRRNRHCHAVFIASAWINRSTRLAHGAESGGLTKRNPACSTKYVWPMVCWQRRHQAFALRRQMRQDDVFERVDHKQCCY